MQHDHVVLPVHLLSVDESSGLYVLESLDEPAPEPGSVVSCVSEAGQPTLPRDGFVVRRFGSYRFAIMELADGESMLE